MNKVPVSVLVVTKNEASNISRCLEALKAFEQVIVIDSMSGDRTCEIARDLGAEVVLYQWNGEYPKKRGWCLENLDIAHDWVFWVDGDEVVTPELVEEIREAFSVDREEAGFFVCGSYIWNGVMLKYGMKNNKIALFSRKKMEFPVIDDLDIEGMGEIEGHYQPVLKAGFTGKIGQLRSSLLHYAYEDIKKWEERHNRYALWEAKMIKRGEISKEYSFLRVIFKNYIKKSVFCPYIVFLYFYIVKFGFLDGLAGYNFAISRKRYYLLIRKYLKIL